MTTAIELGKFAHWQAPPLPSVVRLTARAEAVVARWPDIVPTPPEKDRERLVQEIKRRLETNDWRHTPMSLVTSAARALFDEARRARTDLKGVRQFYYDEICASTRASFLDAMLAVHLGSYQQDADHTKKLADALQFAESRMSARGRQLVQNVPEVLNPVDAPKRIAARMTAMKDCFNALKALGLRSPHAPGLMDHAHLAFVHEIASALRTRATLERLFAWLKPDGMEARVSGAGEAISAVLEPWTNNTPSQADVTWITETLIGMYGDPRVSSGGAWAAVPVDRLAVIMRWLTGRDIQFFMDVLEKVDPTETKMFAERKKLWTELYESGVIVSAWVALSKSARRYVENGTIRSRNRDELAFANQTSGATSAPSLLIMRSRNGRTIVEGSHNHCVYIFRDSQNPPNLFLEEYSALNKNHFNPSLWHIHAGAWQDWVKQQIG